MRTRGELFPPEMARWFEDMDRLFQTGWRGNGGVPVDIEETDGAVVLTVELPGVSREKISIEVDGRQLILRADKTAPEPADEVTCVHVERSYGEFERSFVLGGEIDREQVAAEYRDGVLTVRLPLREAARPRRIEVSG